MIALAVLTAAALVAAIARTCRPTHTVHDRLFDQLDTVLAREVPS